MSIVKLKGSLSRSSQSVTSVSSRAGFGVGVEREMSSSSGLLDVQELSSSWAVWLELGWEYMSRMCLSSEVLVVLSDVVELSHPLLS